jgi:hypothetical protein
VTGEPEPVYVDGVQVGVDPATELPLARLHHLA